MITDSLRVIDFVYYSQRLQTAPLCPQSVIQSYTQQGPSGIDQTGLIRIRRSGQVSAMAFSIEQRITRELARLRMWCDSSGDPAANLIETEAAHDRINQLLDLWQEHSHEPAKRATR